MRILTTLLIVAAATIPSRGDCAIFWVLGDRRDSFQSVRVAQMNPEVERQVKALQAFLDSIVPGSLVEVEKGLGRSSGRDPDSTYVMPLAQTRFVGMGGIHQGRSRAHSEFYGVDSVGGLLVWYLHDSTTVAVKVAYLKMDPHFIPLARETQNQLGTRLAWDRDHLVALERTLRSTFKRRRSRRVRLTGRCSRRRRMGAEESSNARRSRRRG
jgi:hypothetical protein